MERCLKKKTMKLKSGKFINDIKEVGKTLL